MSGEYSYCKEFTWTAGNEGMCNAGKEVLLPIYPNRFEIETFCKTDNHRRCPIRTLAVMNDS